MQGKDLFIFVNKKTTDSSCAFKRLSHCFRGGASHGPCSWMVADNRGFENREAREDKDRQKETPKAKAGDWKLGIVNREGVADPCGLATPLLLKNEFSKISPTRRNT